MKSNIPQNVKIMKDRAVQQGKDIPPAIEDRIHEINYTDVNIDSITYIFVNFLLFKIYKQEYKYENFNITNLFTFSDSFLHQDVEVVYHKNLEEKLPSNKIITYQGIFENKKINIILDFYIDNYGRRVYSYKFHIYCDKNNIKDIEIITTQFMKFIINESYKKCPWKNKIIKIDIGEEDDSDDVKNILKYIKSVEKTELNSLKFEKIYIPEFTKSEINRFCSSIEKNISPLRFIFAGEPGTAKTEILKYVADYLYEKCTIILVNSGEHRLNSIFNLANYLSPSLICIDDIDFIARDRETYSNSETLATFLQKLDGFLDLNSVSILATTNDKNLIDIAAKRPGRFDQIIDIGEIDSENYMNLIKDKLENDTQLLEYFTDDVISDFKKKKVTGSFIVNIIKQLRVYIKTVDIIDEKYIKKFIENSYKGFYKTQLVKNEKTFGFSEKID
jgi:AAA+ superfamily predicted ATPase